jgi:cytosine/uracil/thiamine/allantoin permease
MLSMMIWSHSVTRGVDLIFHQGEKVSSTSRWSILWLMMPGLNQSFGQKAVGMANENDFSRVAKSRMGFVIGTCSVQWLVGVLVSLDGLVTMAACQIIHGKQCYTAFFTGFSISFATFYAVNYFFPITSPGDSDEYDDWATFSQREAARLGAAPNDRAEELVNTRFGASGYERHATNTTEQELEAEGPVQVEIYMSNGKT